MLRDLKNLAPAELEEKILAFWEENRIFEKSLAWRRGKKPFSFYDGPPFATGLPHYGHILASTIKDVVPRYQTMKGRLVRRRWGWDCHGLPIEEVVERQLGISGKKQIEKIGIQKFNEACRSKVLEYASEWKKVVRRIARWVDFDNSYKTMDRDYMESVWWAFKKIYDKGLVYAGRKVLLYCPRCETPISNFEVAMDNSYENVTEEAVTVKFKLTRQNANRLAPGDTAVYLLAWTTTPWTLPGNVALAVGKDIEYVKVKIGNEFYILSKDRLDSVVPSSALESSPGSRIPSGMKVKGNILIGLEYEPLFDVPAVASDKTFKIYAADFVTTDEGTGIVHTAVVYGEDDYVLGVREELPVVPLLDEKGKFNDKAPALIRGKYFKNAEEAIKNDLEKRGFLFRREKHTHSYPHCWRCGTPLYYSAIPAWFVNIQKIKAKLLASNKKEVSWFPAHLKHGRYENSVRDAPDWNISRNRYWGNPIPIWKCESCGAEDTVGSIKELRERAGAAHNTYWVMRHGESEAQLKKIIDSGQGKYHVTILGRDTVRSAAMALKKEGIDAIISSDILRTKETAKLAAKTLAIKAVVFDKRLREIHLPTFAGQPPAAYHRAFPTYETKFEQRPPQGESLRDVRARTWGFLEEIEKKYKGKKILLVSHDYPIWMLWAAAAGWSEKEAIAQKQKRISGDFLKTGEARRLPFFLLPRNASGEVDLHRPYIDAVTLACKKCRGTAKRITEIFDSWVEAGSMPFAEHHYPFENKKFFEDRFPAQFVAEYIAQTRAWFYVMHVISLILFDRAPFDNVVTTGTILAEDGSKMSKSKENFPDPWDVINRYGVDALRLYLMGSVVMQADNLNFSVKDVEVAYRKIVLLLRNVYNYFEMYADPRWRAQKTAYKKMALDKWIESRTEELVLHVTKGLDAYDTVRAVRSIAEYVDDLSTWYLRRSRKRNDPAFFGTLHACLLATSKVIAPFAPYLAEALYAGLGRYEARAQSLSVHLTDWPAGDKKKIDPKLSRAMREVRRLASMALAKRAEAGIRVRQPLALLQIRSTKFEIRNRELLEILMDEVNVKGIVFDKKLKDEMRFDTRITPALREEGLLRELTRMIQGLRQEAKLMPRDAIDLFLDGDSDIEGIAARHMAELKNDVGAKRVTLAPTSKYDAALETKIDNQRLWAGIKKL